MSRVIAAAVLICAGLSRLPAAAVPPEQFQDLSWRLLGPLRAGWSLNVAGVPDELDTFYFGGADGGVWKTNDAGLTWRSISDQAPFSSVGALAVVPGPKRILYVGSGQIQTRHDVMEGNGVWKSEDDGKSWTALGLEDTLHIGRLWVDPRDPNVVLVAALGHLFGPNTERGVFRTADGGRTWSKVAFVNEDTGAADLAADPDTPDVIYASFWQVRRYPWQAYHVAQVGPGSGIYRSTDGGKTWAPTSRRGLPEGPLGRIALAVAPGTQGQRVWASVAAGQGAGVYRSDDGGASWTAQTLDRSFTGNYMAHVFADPHNSNVLFGMGQSFRRSDDGGKTFRFVKGSPGGDDYHFLWINPKHPERMALASDQGTTVSVNGGETWSPWYNQATGQFYRLGIDNGFPYRVYSGQQDNGTVSIASRSNYGQLTFRDWHSVGGDERDGDLPDATDQNLVYGSGLGGKLSRWDARTGRVANVSPWPISSYGQRPAGKRNRTSWITPIAIDPRPPHALFQGTQELHRSLDKGQTWETISPDLSLPTVGGVRASAEPCEGEPPIERATACGFGVIWSIAPSPVTSGLIWVGTDNGRVQVTRDGGGSWSDVTPPALADWSAIAQIDASPTEEGAAYVAVDRHRRDDRAPYIFVTHDFGASWRRADHGLPMGAWVNVVRQDPIRHGLLYAGTRLGVFVSFNDGASWQPLQLNLPRSGVNDLLVHGNDLVIATQGRALWVLDDLSPLRILGAPELPAVALLPPAPAVRLSANENKDTPLPPEVPSTPNPPTGALLDYLLPPGFVGEVKIEIVDAGGALVHSFSSTQTPVRAPARQYFHERWLEPLRVPTAKAGHNRFVWNLRYPQPKATEYEFSIAATPSRGTATLPQGPLVLPGEYRVQLTAGGVSHTASLTVLQDPRSVATSQALEEQLTLERAVIADLAAVVDQLAEVEKQREELEGVAAGKPGTDGRKPSKRQISDAKARAEHLSRYLAGGELDLEAVGSVLSGLETDLEFADGPPTGPQREVYREMKARLEQARAERKKGGQ